MHYFPSSHEHVEHRLLAGLDAEAPSTTRRSRGEIDCPLPAGSRRSQAWGKSELPLADEDVGVPRGIRLMAFIC